MHHDMTQMQNRLLRQILQEQDQRRLQLPAWMIFLVVATGAVLCMVTGALLAVPFL
jgi:hypothetical protein